MHVLRAAYPYTVPARTAGIARESGMGDRLAPSPQVKALSDLRHLGVGDETLMNAALMFNTLVRDGSAIECDDDNNQGFQKLY